MSGPTDVLAVMEAAAVALNYPIGMRSSELVDRRDALRSARAAVAELIDKVDSALALGWSDTAARELRAARARCGVAK